MEDLAYIFLKVAKKLMKLGIKDVKVISASELDKKVKAQVNTENWFWDRKYYYTNLDTWKEIVKRTHVEEIRYISSIRDCENIAMIMHSRVSEIFELNAFATVLGAVYEGDKLIGYHAWNAFYCDDGVYFLEPQSDEIAKAEKDKTRVGKWLYEPFLMIWY